MHSLFFTIRCDAALVAIHLSSSMASSMQVLSSNNPHNVRLCSWLPLMAGGITFYAGACSSSSYFLISGAAMDACSC